MTKPDMVALYRTLVPRLVRRTAALLADAADAEDLVHDAFVRAFRALPAFPDSADAENWLFRVVKNLALNTVRDRSRRRRLLRRSSPVLPSSIRNPAPSRILLDQLIKHLEANGLEMVTQYFLQEMTQGELAARLGISRRVAGYRIQETRGVLAALIEEIDLEDDR